MTTQLYLMGRLMDGRVLTHRELTQLRAVRATRREARAERRARHARRD